MALDVLSDRASLAVRRRVGLGLCCLSESEATNVWDTAGLGDNISGPLVHNNILAANPAALIAFRERICLTVLYTNDGQGYSLTSAFPFFGRQSGGDRYHRSIPVRPVYKLSYMG